MIMDCLSGERIHEGLPRVRAVEVYEKLGGAKKGYCIGEDVEKPVIAAVVQQAVVREPATGMLF